MELDPEDLAASAPLVARASAFIKAIWVDQDLRAAWRYTDPLLRTCWAQAWLHPLLAQARANGFSPAAVVVALASDDPEHELWEPFSRTQVKHLVDSYAVDLDTWGFASGRVLVAPDVELLRFLPVPASGVIQPGEQYVHMPLLMRFCPDDGWRVLNFVSERIPEPGWPPIMQ